MSCFTDEVRAGHVMYKMYLNLIDRMLLLRSRCKGFFANDPVIERPSHSGICMLFYSMSEFLVVTDGRNLSFFQGNIKYQSENAEIFTSYPGSPWGFDESVNFTFNVSFSLSFIGSFVWVRCVDLKSLHVPCAKLTPAHLILPIRQCQ